MTETQYLICDECNGEGCRYCRGLGEIREGEDDLREVEEYEKALWQLDAKEGLI